MFREKIRTCPEIVLYFIIDAFGAFIWRMNHDMADGRIAAHHHPAIDKDIVQAGIRQREAVEQCKRFGIEQPFDNDGKAGPDYWKWYRWWDAWKHGMSNDEWDIIDAASSRADGLTEEELQRYRPPGSWQTEATNIGMDCEDATI